MSLVPPHVELDDDQAVLIEGAREFAHHELLPRDRRWDEDESSVAQILPQLCDMGFLSLLVPETLNGLGCPYTTYTAILHEIARYSPSTCVTIAVHSLVGSVLERFAAEPLRTQCLSSWGSPDNLSAFALSEAGAGSDVTSVSTRAERAEGGYRLEGEKMWVTNGLSARWLLALVRLQGLPRKQDYCAVLVDGNQPGVSREKIRGKMGIRGSETAVISLNQAFVPDHHLIGLPGQGLEVFLTSLNRGRIAIAAQATGIAEACLEEMVSYARQREQFGRPIGSFPGVADMIADSATELAAAKALVWKAGSSLDARDERRITSSMAKVYAAEAANRIAYRAVQVHGGTGYVHECRVEQLYRDARITTIYEGTSQIQRIVIARELSKL